MSHRVQHNKDDWANIPANSRTRWQRLAAVTYGYVTPGNAITLAGLLLSLVGAIKVYDDALLSGFILLAVGRFSDILDGYAATYTKTRGRVGEAFDAGSDKLAALAVLVAFIAHYTIPLLPLAVLLVSSAINSLFGILARIRNYELHSSKLGKYAAVLQWLLVLVFLLSRLVSAHNDFIANLVASIGYILLIPLAVLSIDTGVGYARHALRDTSGKKYRDETGVLHVTVARFAVSWWRKK